MEIWSPDPPPPLCSGLKAVTTASTAAARATTGVATSATGIDTPNNGLDGFELDVVSAVLMVLDRLEGPYAAAIDVAADWAAAALG